MKKLWKSAKMKRPFSVGIALTLFVVGLLVSGPVFAAGGGEHHGFPWGTWLVSLLNFSVFLGVIIFVAGPKINAYFAGRRESFVANLNEAQRLREEAEARLEEYKARIDALEIEREKLLEEYQAQGEAEKRRIIEATQKQVEKMRVDAEATIEQEVKKAVASLEEQAVNLAVELAQNMVIERMDNQRQNQLVDHYVNELKSVDSVPQSEAA